MYKQHTINVLKSLKGVLIGGFVLALLCFWPLNLKAAEEMVQCVDNKGESAIFRQGACQPLSDPTTPSTYQPGKGEPGALSHGVEMVRRSTATGSNLSDAVDKNDDALATLKRELESLKKKLTEIQDVGRFDVNATKGEDVESLGTPGPWTVSQILVPTEEKKGSNLQKRAVINGYRYRLGDRADGGVVKEISRDRVVMLHDGKETVVPFDKTTHASIYGRLGSVPLTRDPSGIYSLKVRINNNQEIDAVVDTGASKLVLPEDIVTWLTRSGTLAATDFVGQGQAKIADGSLVETRVFKIRSLRVGDMELKDLEGAEIAANKSGKEEKKSDDPMQKGEKPLTGAELTPPLFGINALRMLGKWRIDHISSQLIVER